MKAMKATKATKATASVTKKKPAAAPQATSAPASARSKGPMLKEYETMESDLGTDRSSMTRSDKVALLDAKVRAYKERDGKGISFSQPEMRCLCNRWGDTGLLAAPQQVQEMWVDTLQKGRGENKEMAKRAMVFAWLKDEESELWFCELVQLIIFPDDVVITIYIYICIYIYIYIYIFTGIRREVLPAHREGRAPAVAQAKGEVDHEEAARRHPWLRGSTGHYYLYHDMFAI